MFAAWRNGPRALMSRAPSPGAAELQPWLSRRTPFTGEFVLQLADFVSLLPANTQMRILHIQKATGIAGSERHLLALLPLLAQKGHDIYMLTLVGDGGERFVTSLRTAGVETATVTLRGNASAIALHRVRDEIRRIRPDLVHTHLIHADVYGQLAAWRERVPGVSTMHGTDVITRHRTARIARVLMRMSAGHARRTIAVSEHAARAVTDARVVAPGEVRVVHHGIDPAPWTAASVRRDALRSRLGVGDDEVMIGIASRLIPFKGHDFLIRGLARARRREKRLHLFVAGDGPLRASLSKLANELLDQAVHFLGFVEDIPGFMAACDVVALPTLPEFDEGFGLVALEAMAAARPVIATNVGPLPEITLDGETGRLVASDDIDALADALIEICDDGLRRRLGGAGRRRAAEEFSLEKMVDATAAVYDEIVRG